MLPAGPGADGGQSFGGPPSGRPQDRARARLYSSGPSALQPPGGELTAAWKGNVESHTAVQTAEDSGGTVSHLAKPPVRGSQAPRGGSRLARSEPGAGLPGDTGELLVSGFLAALLCPQATPLTAQHSAGRVAESGDWPQRKWDSMPHLHPQKAPCGCAARTPPRLAPWACVIYELNPHTSKPLVQTPCPTGSNSGPEGTQETPPSKHAMYFKKQRHRIILTVAQNRQSVSEGSARC